MPSCRHRIISSSPLQGRCRTSCCIDGADRGQGTVEAAFALPVLLLLALLLIQPGIVLYDRMVMQSAAAEGCRLLATGTSALGGMGDACEAFIRHRLGAVPQQDCFHVHDGADGCSWDITLQGDETAQTVTVRIANELRPLPLLDAGATLLGMVNDAGNIELEVEVEAPAQPGWAQDAFAGRSPAEWIGEWLE